MLPKFVRNPDKFTGQQSRGFYAIYMVHQISALSINDNHHTHISKGFVMLTMEGILTLANHNLETFSSLVLDSSPGALRDRNALPNPPLRQNISLHAWLPKKPFGYNDC